jgi:hypothetical protein
VDDAARDLGDDLASHQPAGAKPSSRLKRDVTLYSASKTGVPICVDASLPPGVLEVRDSATGTLIARIEGACS